MNPAIQTAVSELRQLLTDRLTRQDEVRESHGKDYSWHQPAVPDAVCFPENEEEVCEIVRICAKHQVPLIPYGAGSSLEGGVLAVRGGITVDLNRMNRILNVSPADMDCTVEGGARRYELNDRLAQDGLFFPVDPGANATLAGMAATRASGTSAVRYGTMKENVVSLKVVLPDGRLIKTGTRALKSAAGYDLTKLFVGSEGTLGIITEVTLRVHRIPEHKAAAVVSFPDIAQAVEAVVETRKAGIPMARLELLDELMMRGMNRHADMDYPEQPTLFLEFQGSEDDVQAQVRKVEAIMLTSGGNGFQWASDEEARERLWHARHNAHYAALALRPGSKAMATDVCVPLSRLASCIARVRQDLAKTSLLAPMVGHVGEGNFHLQYLINPDDPAEVAEAQRLHEALVHHALSLGGTCTGEHGVGLGKLKYLKAEYGEAYHLLVQLKKTIDPQNIMNPGKVIAL